MGRRVVAADRTQSRPSRRGLGGPAGSGPAPEGGRRAITA